MNSPAHDTALYLAAQGVGAFGGDAQWSIHVGTEARTPDDVITVYDTGGEGADTDGQDIDRPALQVRVRGASYADAFDKHEEIRDLLVVDTPITMTTSTMRFREKPDVLSIGRDDNNRHILTANYRALRH